MQITWQHVINAIAVTADHVHKGLCERPEKVPVKVCVRKSTDGFCCTRHLDQRPVVRK